MLAIHIPFCRACPHRKNLQQMMPKHHRHHQDMKNWQANALVLGLRIGLMAAMLTMARTTTFMVSMIVLECVTNIRSAPLSMSRMANVRIGGVVPSRQLQKLDTLATAKVVLLLLLLRTTVVTMFQVHVAQLTATQSRLANALATGLRCGLMEIMRTTVKTIISHLCLIVQTHAMGTATVLDSTLRMASAHIGDLVASLSTPPQDTAAARNEQVCLACPGHEDQGVCA